SYSRSNTHVSPPLLLRFFSLYIYFEHRDLHSFPTRRSSDLGEIPMILRTGLITKEDIIEVVGACDMAPSLEMPSNKYKHYTPEVPLILVQSKAQLIELVEEEKRKNKRVGVIVPEAVQDMHVQKMHILGKEETENARNLYDVLRAIQKTEVDVVISAPFKSKI